ncbi:MAG: hypothetical protein A2W80_15825 [Candidatus Riflebacteria bacterium GWC2_50_8]|nr:MAG: hypothetical protein A2W80_15825 [Candidatus Riflebacteria bacterium GWC2_50_8]
MKIDSIADSILGLIREKDSSLFEHNIRVGDLASALAEALGMDEKTVFLTKIAGKMHDIGKLSVPESVLYKRGSYVDVEMDIMKRHSVLGARYLAVAFGIPSAHADGYIDGLIARCREGNKEMPGSRDMIVSGVLFHHEKIDGSGYPSGLKGAKIPLMATILCLADYYIAMREKRAYRDGYDNSTVLELVTSNRNRLFNTPVVDKLCEFIRADRRYKLDASVEGKTRDAQRFFLGRAGNISLSGMYIKTGRITGVGQELVINFAADGSIVDIPAIVSRIDKDGIGVKFIHENGTKVFFENFIMNNYGECDGKHLVHSLFEEAAIYE